MAPSPRRCGFTLIELLTVVAIVSILAALIFPVLSRSKKSAKKASALTQVRQLTAAMLTYAVDADDKPSPYCGQCAFSDAYPPVIQDGPHIWMALMLPYVGSKGKPSGQWNMYLPEDLPDIFFDPNERRIPLAQTNCQQFGTVASWGISDAIVRRLGTVEYPGQSDVRPASSFGNPSKTILFAQTSSYSCDVELPGVALAVPAWNGLHGWSAETTLDGIYDGNRNLVGLLDGSAKLLPKAQLTNSMEYWGD